MEARHRLFFAIRPPDGLVPEIAVLRDRDGAGHGRVADHRLHLTTWLFPDRADFPHMLVERARQAVDTLDLRRFGIAFDRMTGDDRGIRLLPSEPILGYMAFQRTLAAALARAGLRSRSGWRFAPHMTLRYGGRQSIDEAIVPVSWVAQELVLIDSILGAHRHETLAHWTLS